MRQVKSHTGRSLKAMVDANERPYSIDDLAVLHNLSRRTVIRLYENEPGVLVLQASREQQRAMGRRYRTIRVPRHVYMRVKHRLENR
jgi:transcriptional regulator GlxA family with amidase domain